MMRLDEIRDAVGLTLDAFTATTPPLTDQQWEGVVSTLIAGREQLGGTPRQLINDLLTDQQPHHQLCDALTTLQTLLDTPRRPDERDPEQLQLPGTSEDQP